MRSEARLTRGRWRMWGLAAVALAACSEFKSVPDAAPDTTAADTDGLDARGSEAGSDAAGMVDAARDDTTTAADSSSADATPADGPEDAADGGTLPADAPAMDAADGGTDADACALTVCGGACVDTQTDVRHCGACGRACAAPANATATCADGVCGFTCEAGFHRCGEACVGDTSPATCGTRCEPCPAPANGAATCAAGACGLRCDAGFTRCGTACVDTRTDVHHCGACGQDCATLPFVDGARVRCAESACVIPDGACGPGRADCNRDASDGCEADLSRAVSCGACGTTCAGATPLCRATGDPPRYACASGCDASQTRCSGSCVDTATDVAHCGGCGRACAAPANATATCAASACGFTCDAGFADCDGDAANGCETDTRTAVAHCGACGRSCPPAVGGSATCAAGACGQACPAGQSNCGGTCRATGASCTAGVGACARTGALVCAGTGTTCSATPGAASAEVCDGVDNDCDGTVDGAAAAGACPARANATARCASGACSFACAEGFGDCDASAANGCETDQLADPRNCGGCGAAFACAPGEACVAGACRAWAWRSTRADATDRSEHACVWTGRSMLAWGGYYSGSGYFNPRGARYDLATDTWSPLSATGSPSGRYLFASVWTGAEMIIWGGQNVGGMQAGGARYDPATDRWRALPDGGLGNRQHPTAVWTGSEMIVWGGSVGYGCPSFFNTGGRYDPALDRWRPMSTAGAPSARERHVAVWTGSEMIVWGGGNCATRTNSGGRYDPATDTWRSISTTDAPAPRVGATAVWTGSEMIVWGSDPVPGTPTPGGRYDPRLDRWTPMTMVGAPSSRWGHTAVWTGSEMIVWGGGLGEVGRDDGAAYNPVTDTWRPLPTADRPGPRFNHCAVWTGSEMLVFGGRSNATTNLATGGRLGFPTAQRSCPDPSARGCGLTRVSGGTFAMGVASASEARNASPPQPSITVRSFALDTYEVTVARFRHFWEAGHPAPPSTIAYPGGPLAWTGTVQEPTPSTATAGCNWTSSPDRREDHPVNCVDWWTAQAFCTWDGGRLPTEAEWEFAARGRSLAGRPSPRTYPWGNEAPMGSRTTPCDRAHWNTCVGDDGLNTRRVGGLPATGGIHDLAGNVYELVADTYRPYSDATCWGGAARTNPLCVAGVTDERVARGGHFEDRDPIDLAGASRHVRRPEARGSDATGFRCAR